MEKEMRRLQQKTSTAQRLFALCHQQLSSSIEVTKRAQSAQLAKRNQVVTPTLYKTKSSLGKYGDENRPRTRLLTKLTIVV